MISLNLSKRWQERQQLDFSNDMSRIVRGIAVVMMVIGHSLPGKIIPYAVPLFSFLVGYGYAFAKKHSARHSLTRIVHLLSHFWFILFLVCIPAAIISWKGTIKVEEVALNMFGLSARFNFYCWYIYFYIAAMLLMPWLSRFIDRYGLKATILEAAIFGAIATAIFQFLGSWLTTGHTNIVVVIYRVCRYMPTVVVGYWLAHYRVFSRVPIFRHPLFAIGCAILLIGFYLLRKFPYMQCADLIWAPLSCCFIGSIFNLYRLAVLRIVLTEFGLKSMGIWFLHALFFTHSTRGLFRPLINWIPADNWLSKSSLLPDKTLQVIAIIFLSYIMGAIIDYLYARYCKLFGRVRGFCLSIPIPFTRR